MITSYAYVCQCWAHSWRLLIADQINYDSAIALMLFYHPHTFYHSCRGLSTNVQHSDKNWVCFKKAWRLHSNDWHLPPLWLCQAVLCLPKHIVDPSFVWAFSSSPYNTILIIYILFILKCASKEFTFQVPLNPE